VDACERAMWELLRTYTKRQGGQGLTGACFAFWPQGLHLEQERQ
jgi:hypothetical protein